MKTIRDGKSGTAQLPNIEAGDSALGALSFRANSRGLFGALLVAISASQGFGDSVELRPVNPDGPPPKALEYKGATLYLQPRPAVRYSGAAPGSVGTTVGPALPQLNGPLINPATPGPIFNAPSVTPVVVSPNQSFSPTLNPSAPGKELQPLSDGALHEWEQAHTNSLSSTPAPIRRVSFPSESDVASLAKVIAAYFESPGLLRAVGAAKKADELYGKFSDSIEFAKNELERPREGHSDFTLVIDPKVTEGLEALNHEIKALEPAKLSPSVTPNRFEDLFVSKDPAVVAKAHELAAEHLKELKALDKNLDELESKLLTIKSVTQGYFDLVADLRDAFARMPRDPITKVLLDPDLYWFDLDQHILPRIGDARSTANERLKQVQTLHEDVKLKAKNLTVNLEAEKRYNRERLRR
jgi:hypothetical protein